MPGFRILVAGIGRSMARPALYVTIVMAVVLATFFVKIRTEGVFGCPASGYAKGQSYLAYCQTNQFGDYDHGAFWYGLDPSARNAAAKASVLFLGNSRMQFGFSTDATRNWFAANPVSYYLLGFSYGENMVFEQPLLEQRLHPTATVYVINVDRFFDKNFVTPVAAALTAPSADLQSGYRDKERWQWFHERLCGAVSALCGHNVAFYRERETGAWQLRGHENFKTSAIGDDKPDAEDFKQAQRDATAAREFLATLPVPRECVVLTLVPWSDTPNAAAHAMADALKLDLIAPQVAGLHTFDGDHLDTESAERWSTAFYQAAGPRIRQCLSDGQLLKH